MERLIKRWDARKDKDLMICDDHGVAYQGNMQAGAVAYDKAYLDKCSSYNETIAQNVNAGRVALIAKHLEAPATLLDVGAGDCAFLRSSSAAGYTVRGFDVIPDVRENLQAAGLFADDVFHFDGVCMWDSIEHMEDPDRFLRQRPNTHLFVSIPIFKDLNRIRESKHYRPGEHLYYWTGEGFVAFMELHGFRLLELSSHEMDAGRVDICAFAFRRDLPGYHDHIKAYQEIHSTGHYGSSATELHLQTVMEAVRLRQPRSIVDYGCGRSDLVAHFWLDGQRKIARYDPAIPGFSVMPTERFDLALVCDVMEHIPMANVDRILLEVQKLAPCALFTISLKLARKKLPDGRNSHVTLLKAGEWARWLESVFGSVRSLPSAWEHEIVLLAGAGK